MLSKEFNHKIILESISKFISMLDNHYKNNFTFELVEILCAFLVWLQVVLNKYQFHRPYFGPLFIPRGFSTLMWICNLFN